MTFYDRITQRQMLAAYPDRPMDTIFWVVPPQTETANFASVLTIYKVDYDIWHKRFGHPSKDVLRRAKELKNFPTNLQFPEHPPICRGCAEGKLHSKSFPESSS